MGNLISSPTTQNPSSTMQIPSSTMQIPSSTMQIPSSTMQIPSSTMQNPSSTMQIPSSTMQIPSSTMQIPSSTMQIPSSTMQIPSSTMQSSTTTTTEQPRETAPLIAEELARNIINLQNRIIKFAQENINRASNLDLDASKIENFANQNNPGFYQQQLYVPKNDIQELNDYISAYNKSVALLEDPNNMTQANFDAYIHLQNKKIADIQKSIASFPTKNEQQANPIRAIKNLKTSVGLNVEPYPDPATQKIYPSYYNGNGSSSYPNYLIYTNNGCLQYAPSSTNGDASSWSVQPCNSNLPGQRFNMQQINNMAQYNGLITNPNNASHKITDTNSSIFGFYVVNPEGYNEECLQLNNDGLSVMPCNMDSSQRFKPYYHSITP